MTIYMISSVMVCHEKIQKRLQCVATLLPFPVTPISYYNAIPDDVNKAKKIWCP